MITRLTSDHGLNEPCAMDMPRLTSPSTSPMMHSTKNGPTLRGFLAPRRPSKPMIKSMTPPAMVPAPSAAAMTLAACAVPSTSTVSPTRNEPPATMKMPKAAMATA